MGFITNRAKADFAKKVHDWVNDTVRVILVTSANNATADNDFVGDITTLGELSGTGYVAGFGGSGRHVLSTKTVLQDNANDRIELKAANETWTAIEAGTIAAGLIVRPVTTDADSYLIGKVDLAVARVTNSGDFIFKWADESAGVGVVFRHGNA